VAIWKSIIVNEECDVWIYIIAKDDSIESESKHSIDLLILKYVFYIIICALITATHFALVYFDICLQFLELIGSYSFSYFYVFILFIIFYLQLIYYIYIYLHFTRISFSLRYLQSSFCYISQLCKTDKHKKTDGVGFY